MTNQQSPIVSGAKFSLPLSPIAPCPPHQWAHAPTVGYFRCGQCGEQINYDDPRYDPMLKERTGPGS